MSPGIKINISLHSLIYTAWFSVHMSPKLLSGFIFFSLITRHVWRLRDSRSFATAFSGCLYSVQICADHKPCEIDPVKLKESENLETNRVGFRLGAHMQINPRACMGPRVCLWVCMHGEGCVHASCGHLMRLRLTPGELASVRRPPLHSHHQVWGQLSHSHV